MVSIMLTGPIPSEDGRIGVRRWVRAAAVLSGSHVGLVFIKGTVLRKVRSPDGHNSTPKVSKRRRLLSYQSRRPFSPLRNADDVRYHLKRRQPPLSRLRHLLRPLPATPLQHLPGHGRKPQIGSLLRGMTMNSSLRPRIRHRHNRSQLPLPLVQVRRGRCAVSRRPLLRARQSRPPCPLNLRPLLMFRRPRTRLVNLPQTLLPPRLPPSRLLLPLVPQPKLWLIPRSQVVMVSVLRQPIRLQASPQVRLTAAVCTAASLHHARSWSKHNAPATCSKHTHPSPTSS